MQKPLFPTGTVRHCLYCLNQGKMREVLRFLAALAILCVMVAAIILILPGVAPKSTQILISVVAIVLAAAQPVARLL